MTAKPAKLRYMFATWALALGPTVWAQAGDQDFDDVGVIELPGQAAKRPGLRLNWSCDVLLVQDSRRYRPGHCPGDEPDSAAQELTIEQAEDEPRKAAAGNKRKLLY